MDVGKILIAIVCFIFIFYIGNVLFSALLKFVVEGTVHLILTNILALSSAISVTGLVLKGAAQSTR